MDSTAGGFRDSRATMRSTMTVGDRVLHHEFTGRLSSTRESRKAAEAALHSLMNRINMLEEEEDRTKRALLKSRQRAARIDTFRAENGLGESGMPITPVSPITMGAGTVSLGAGAAAAGSPRSTALGGTRATTASGSTRAKSLDPMATTRPPTGSVLAMENSYSFVKPANSPWRTPGIALPPLDRTLGLGEERLAAVHRARDTLKETQRIASSTATALESSALRAEKDVRLMDVANTRAAIYAYCKTLHDHGVHLADLARTRKDEADRDAEVKRRQEFDARVASEEAARLAAEAKLREMAALEEMVLERLAKSPQLRLDAMATYGAGTRATAGVYAVDVGSGGAAAAAGGSPLATLRSIGSPLRPVPGAGGPSATRGAGALAMTGGSTGMGGAGTTLSPLRSPSRGAAAATSSGGGAYSRTRPTGAPAYAIF